MNDYIVYVVMIYITLIFFTTLISKNFYSKKGEIMSATFVKPVLLNMPSDILETMTDYSRTMKRPRTKLVMEALRLWISHQQGQSLADRRQTQTSRRREWLQRDDDDSPPSFFSSSSYGF